MIYKIPEEIIENTILCRHKHGCLSSRAIFPQCMAVGEKRGDGIVVKEKPYCSVDCLYHFDIKGQGNNELSLCFCPVNVEIDKMNGT